MQQRILWGVDLSDTDSSALRDALQRLAPLVDGPQTREDYIDIFSLLVGKNHSIPLGDHKLFAGQVELSPEDREFFGDFGLYAGWKRNERNLQAAKRRGEAKPD